MTRLNDVTGFFKSLQSFFGILKIFGICKDFIDLPEYPGLSGFTKYFQDLLTSDEI